MASGAPAPTPTSFLPEGLLLDLLAVSLTGVNVLRPLYDSASELVDFAIEYLNPAAQQMTGLAERPGGTTRTRFPDLFANGGFAFYRRVFETGEAGRYNFNYQADGFDNYFHVAARRSGDLLVVSFTDTSDHERSAVEVALREAQAAEQAARAQAEHQRRELWGYVQQASVAVVLYQGPQHRVVLANAAALAIWDRSWAEVRQRPVFEVLPEAAAPSLVAIFDRVFTTGEPYAAQEYPTTINRHGQLATVYWSLVFQAQRQADGRVSGVISVGTDVTEQVLARRQVQQLNQELEARVQARTQELHQQQALLQQILGQAPAAMGTLNGPEHRYTFFNDRYRALSTDRLQLGRPVAEAHPEVVAQGFVGILDEVYATGQAFTANELSVQLYDNATDQLEQRYLDYVYQPLTNEQGQTTGILVFVLDVTEKVQTRARTAALQAQVLAATQRQVQEREMFYQVFEQTPAAIALLRGPEHRFEYHNPAYQQFFPGRALRGRTMAEAVPAAAAQGYVALLDGVFQTGDTFFGREVPFADAAEPARTRYFNATYQAYREEGQIAGISVFASDVTAQVEARQQNEVLQAELLAAARGQADQRALLYQLFEQAPAVVALLRAPGHRYEYVNPAYQALFPGRQLLGRDMADAVPEQVAQGFVALMDRVYQTGETYFGHEQPFTATPPPGQAPRTLYFNFTYQAYRESGDIVGIAIFGYDVTEQVLARQERDAQQRQLRELFEQAPVAIGLFAGPDYMVEVCNPGLQAIWRRTAAEVLDRPLFEVLPEVRDQGFRELLDEVRRTGTAHVAAEMPAELLRHGQAVPVFLNFVYQPIRDAQGGIRAVAAVAADATEQVAARRLLAQANTELTGANEQLTRTNVDLDNFIYTASHDLKAPISNIEGLLLALEHELPAAGRVGDVPLMLTMMQGAVERFKQTIGHLTDVSRLQKEHSPASEQVPLAAVIEAVRLDLLPLIQKTQAQLDVQVAPGVSLTSSEKNLRSVVYNLLSNALKYHHPHRAPQVRLRYEVQDGYQVLEVQDNSLGMDLSQGQEKLFAMFQRMHTHVEGTGIGLYMVKKIVENAGGRIEVVSQLGQGSTFRVYFRR